MIKKDLGEKQKNSYSIVLIVLREFAEVFVGDALGGDA